MDETEKKKRIEIFTETLNGTSSNKPEYEFINKMTAFGLKTINFLCINASCFIIFIFILTFCKGLFDTNNGLIKLYLILMFFSLFINISISPPVSMKHQISSLDGITRIHKRIIKRRYILLIISVCFFISSLIGLGLFFFN